MEIFLLKSILIVGKTQHEYRHYFETLEQAKQGADKLKCRITDKWGGIYIMRPDKEGEFEVFDCVEAW